MKTNSSGNKYFPINLQKKSMVYSGSQPQISFSPPSKSTNSKNDIIQIKMKKDLSSIKYTPQQQVQQQLNTLKINKSLAIPKQNKTINAINADGDLSNSRNNYNNSYYKYYKSDTKDKNNLNAVTSTTNSNILNGNYVETSKNNQNTIKMKDLIQNNQLNNLKNVKSIDKERNEFFKFSRDKSYENSRYLVNYPYNNTNAKDNSFQYGKTQLNQISIRPSSKNNSVKNITDNLKSTNIYNKTDEKEKLQITIKNSIISKANTMQKSDKPPIITPPISAKIINTNEEEKRRDSKTTSNNIIQNINPDSNRNGIKTVSKKLNLSSSTANFIKNKLNKNNEKSEEQEIIDKAIEIKPPEEKQIEENIVLTKKPIKHFHQNSLSENANLEQGFTGGLNYNHNINKKENKEIKEIKEDEDNLSSMLDLTQSNQINNVIFFTNQLLSFDDKLDQNQIEQRVDELISISLKIKTENYECYHKNSKVPLNKVLNRLLRFYSIIILLIKFGILEFLLNNMLQKKIKVLMKVFNSYLFDFIDATIATKIIKHQSNNNGGNKVTLSKETLDHLDNFIIFNKKFQIKSLNIWTFEYQTKMYENKLNSQMKIFLDELFSENYYVSFHASINQIITKIPIISMEQLTFLLEETFYTSLKIKTINNPFDFLAPGKSTGNVVSTFPSKTSSKALTMVLDLDETLIHFAYSPSGGSFIVRPGCMEFLRTVSQYYEIIIFTAATQEYANRVINLIDPKGEYVNHRLYRQHTTMAGGELVKVSNI